MLARLQRERGVVEFNLLPPIRPRRHNQGQHWPCVRKRVGRVRHLVQLKVRRADEDEHCDYKEVDYE